MFFFRLSFLPLLILILSNCKQRFSVTTTAYVIGNNNIIPIGKKESKTIPQAQLHATVVLATPVDGDKKKFCTGTMVQPASPGENYRIITNHHCFARDEADKLKVSRQLLPGHCSDTVVVFGMTYKDPKLREVQKCQIGSFRNDYESDLAVFTLQENPSPHFKPAEFVNDESILENIDARVVHFPTGLNDSHNSQAFEENIGLILPTAHVSEDDCYTQGPFHPSEWDLDRTLGFGFKHSCDQKKGSSGSSLWDKKRNKILGINWGGIIIKYRNPDRSETYNVATSASYAVKFLANQHQPTKQSILNKTQLSENSSSESLKKDTSAIQRASGCGTFNSPESKNSYLSVLLFALPLILIPFFSQMRRDIN